MERLSTTPFGQRPVTAALLDAVARMADAPALPAVDKWHILRELCAARSAFGITDRELGVLEGLLSFFPDQMLGGNSDMIVFPSNRALADRRHGMAESTLRRHLSRLVDAGLILRHDSPNGKRYAARDFDGNVLRAFGFDLSPLHVRAQEIAQAAASARTEAARFKALREAVSLRKRDAQKLAVFALEEGLPGDWDRILEDLLDVTRLLRRRLNVDTLEEISARVETLWSEVQSSLHQTQKMSGNVCRSERHYQNSNADPSDLELCSEKSKEATVHHTDDVALNQAKATDLSLPFPLVLRALPEALAYASEEVRSPNDLVRLGQTLRGMIGISPSAWDDAVAVMGPHVAGLTVCCLTERIHEIRSPGGYLRSLTREAQEGRFSITRLLMALIHRPSKAGRPQS